jgi:hypothetical protein
MYNNQKDICDYLLNLDVMNNGSITKDGNITNINVDFLFKSFISNAKDLNKPDFLEMISRHIHTHATQVKRAK